MIFETITVGPMQVNCYVLACGRQRPAIIIDPGDDPDKIKKVLERHELKPGMIINTHGHYDHIGSDDEFGVDIYVHQDDNHMLVDANKNLSAFFSKAYKVKSGIKFLEEKQAIKLDCLELEVLHLPGHTLGGIGLLMKKPEADIIFTGDTLFYQGIGRYDLEGGSRQILEKSIKEKLLVLPGNTRVYPGHGPSTTIANEKQNLKF